MVRCNQCFDCDVIVSVHRLRDHDDDLTHTFRDKALYNSLDEALSLRLTPCRCQRLVFLLADTYHKTVAQIALNFA